MNSELRFAHPQTQSDLVSFMNQRDSGNASSRLDYLQIMTAFLRGSPNAAITSQINALLSSQLAQNMTLEQILVPRAAGSMSGEAVLEQFAGFTPEAKKLFLLKLARATLTICQLITSELAQTSQAVRTSSSSAETSPSATPEPSGPAAQTYSEDEPPPQRPQSAEVAPAAGIANLQPSAEAVTEAGLDEINAAQASLKEAAKQKVIKRLEEADGHNGVLRNLECKCFEMSSLRYNPMSEEKFVEMVVEGQDVFDEVNQYIPLLQDDAETCTLIRKVFALVLQAKLLGEMFASIHRDEVEGHPTFVKHPYYRTILSMLEGIPPPWDFNAIYQKIKDFFNTVHREHANENTQPRNIPFTDFTLADVSLDPNAKLSRRYCLKALGLSPQATADEMRSAYKRLCLQHHPDKNPGDEEQATAMFLRLQIVATQLKIIM
ncbi:MAG: J domain-containing protein [Vibrionaceae bacterium]